MLRIGCWMVLVVLAVVIAIPAVAAHYLPWWGTLLLVVGELVVLAYGVPKLVKWVAVRALARIVGMKSKVLRGAAVEVHSVARVPKPVRRVEHAAAEEEILTPDGTVVTGAVPGEEPAASGEKAEDEEKDAPGTRYVRIECTITPKGSEKSGTPMQFFEPSEMLLVPYGREVSVASMLTKEGDGEAGAGTCEEAMVVGEDAENASGKYSGAQRIEFVFRCPPELKGRVKFQYYFETIGDLEIPE